MAIKVREVLGSILEPCAVRNSDECEVLTQGWTDLESRTPHEQVACCEPCGKTVEPHQVPSKREWFHAHKRRM